MSNVCQNGLSPGGAAVKTEAGVPNVALPAVPLPESVARSLAPPGAPFTAPSSQQPHAHPLQPTASGGVPVSAAGGGQPTPKPLYRPFAISPPPSKSSSSGATPTTTATPSFATSQHHPAYRPFDPYYPNSGQHNPLYPGSSAATPPFNAGRPSYNAATPSTVGTHTVASSHNDLTCKSHLPKLAHALTTTTPRSAPPPSPSHAGLHKYSHLSDPRGRDDHHRYLHDRNLAGALRPPHFMGTDVTSNPAHLASSLAPPHQRPANHQSPFLGPLVSLSS